MNRLVNSQPSGVVYLSTWLMRNGFSTQLLNRYKKSNWLTIVVSTCNNRN
ncbi:MAG: AbiEi antitoxin N-terminal domain-containing protein [Lutibacter sp.]